MVPGSTSDIATPIQLKSSIRKKSNTLLLLDQVLLEYLRTISINQSRVEETIVQDDKHKPESASYCVCFSTEQSSREDQTTKSASHVPPTRAQESLSTPKGSPPALLSIAQELRDIIFAHVFNTADPNSTVDLRIIPCDNIREDVRAGTLSREPSPPTKDPLLLCRQLHTEQRQAHAAAYRRYWDSQRFHITTDRPYLLAKLRLASEPDLRHIRCFSIAPMLKRTRIKLLITFRFEAASKWLVAVERSPRSKARPGEEVPWQLTECARRDAFLESLRKIMDRLRTNWDGPSSIDPAVGQGLNSNEMYELSSLIWDLVWNPDGE